MELTPAFVPENIEGKPVDIEYKVTEKDLLAAQTTYNRVCKRLLNPPVWKQLAGSLSAEFALFSPDNQPAERLIEKGDYLRIDIPGPGSKAGEGYDWVRVEALQDGVAANADESFGIKLRSSKNPANPGDGTAHFFTENASSTFIVKRQGLTVAMCYYGRNELPNTNNDSMVDKVRNSLVAAGALAGMSNLQWNALAKGLLSDEIGA